MNLSLKQKITIAIIIPILVLLLYFYIGKPKSREAFINASLSTVISPVSGIITYSNKLDIGNELQSDQVIAEVISNESNNQIYQLINEKLSLEQKEIEINGRLVSNEKLFNKYYLQKEKYRIESEKQRSMEVKKAKLQKEKLKIDMGKIITDLNFQNKKLESYVKLHRNNHIGLIEFEDKKREVDLLKSALKYKQVEINQQIQEEEAILNGLQLSGARTLDGPQQNMRDLDITISNVRSEIDVQELQLDAVRKRLKVVNKLLDEQKKVTVINNTKGIIWEINTQNASGINFGSPIIKVLNCENMWVDAFFDESDAENVLPGNRVTIRLESFGSKNNIWSGTIQNVRSGSGRVAVGETVVMPPPEIARRQLPVKVIAARINVDWDNDAKPNANLFCLAGRSVVVSL